MNRLFLFLFLPTLGFAQWIVSDPGNTAVNAAIEAAQAANHLEVLRQWAAQVEQLNRQIRQLEDQLGVQRRIRDVMGDPSAAGAQVVLRDLGAPDLVRAYGDTWREVRRLSEAMDTLRRTADRVYSALDDRTVMGRDFSRTSAAYRRFAAVEQAADNVEGVSAEARTREAVLQANLADALQRLQSASTQAEVDKLTVTVAALNGQLMHVAEQRRAAAEQVLMQQALNENQSAKERQDLLEKQIEEERHSLAIANAWQTSIRITPDEYSRR